jgi:lipocalin
MDHASKNVFNTRFNAFWNNTWKDTDFPDNSERDMKPNDYDVLKSDREYRYFLETLKNQLYWYVRSPLKQANEKADHLVFQIDNELRELKK